MSFPVYDKDPNAVLDYAFDWSAWLSESETISAHDVTVPAGITLDSSEDTDDTVTAWLSGGTLGTTYTVVCQITTNQARTDERSIIIRAKDM